jgi:hypothetical protein
MSLFVQFIETNLVTGQILAVDGGLSQRQAIRLRKGDRPGFFR